MNEKTCRRLVAERADGLCELMVPEVCEGRARNMSHRKARGQGGPWEPSNVMAACGSGTTGCHGWLERNPRAGRAFGWRVRHADKPVTAPVLHAHHGWCLLSDDGTFTRVCDECLEPGCAGRCEPIAKAEYVGECVSCYRDGALHQCPKCQQTVHYVCLRTHLGMHGAAA